MFIGFKIGQNFFKTAYSVNSGVIFLYLKSKHPVIKIMCATALSVNGNLGF